MYETAETRWVFEGRTPDPVGRWFDRERRLEPELRTDRYVVLPGCETVGIKLRGDAGGAGGAGDAGGAGERAVQLEVKARRGGEETVRLAADVSGLAAAWTKWTLALRADAILSGLGPSTPTLTLRKQRLQRRFVPHGEGLREIAVADEAVTGCDIELTTIRVDGLDRTWWSLGLEAFGLEAQVGRTLRSVGAAWFEPRGAPPLDPPRRLDVGSSSAYPAWLMGLPAPPV